MKQLKFEHLFAQEIIQNKRNTTLRIDDKNIMIGERVQLVDKISSNKPQEWEVPGDLIITGKQMFRLDNMPLELLKDTELDSADKDMLYSFLRRFYGESMD